MRRATLAEKYFSFDRSEDLMIKYCPLAWSEGLIINTKNESIFMDSSKTSKQFKLFSKKFKRFIDCDLELLSGTRAVTFRFPTFNSS